MKFKKAEDNLLEQIAYLLFLIALGVILFLVINRVSNNSTSYENIYAKKIAMTIDRMSVNSNVSLDISELYKIAKKNEFSYSQMISINNDENFVLIKLSEGKGYKFYFFNDLDIEWNLNEGEVLYLES